ncbi:restriction endonuclease subunit S [Helicobacter japonicus]|uniref:Restriction endonuclease subunit S n=2 Tax=Helicobacter japonicus TaxID=425400 RepID=A0A4U8TNC6_9HELI|nr:restriction endonuclease subunit S [Helicobacter japonicus]TLE02032.1 restriction endonuclease subunit S [Helicobacter japonicus]
MVKHNLPKNWEVKTLGECLTYEQPTKYIVKNTQYSDEYEIPVLTAGKSFLLGYTNDTENIFTQTPVIIFDDFTTDSKFVDFHFKVKSSAMKILHATKIANIKFVFYFMQTIQYRSDTHKRYWISEYAKLPIPLPPLEVQKAIVEKLESAFAHIDEAVRHLKAVQTNIPRLKSSLLHSAFSGKLTESQNQSNEVQTLKSIVGVEGEFEREEGATSRSFRKKLAQTCTFKPLHPLIKAEIPQGWEIKTLGEVCEIVTGSTPSKDNAEYYGDDFPFYKPTDLNNGYYVEAASDNVSPKGFEISRQLPSGSVLVTCIGATIGKTGLIRKKGICNQQINAILPSQKFISEFIYFYCISPKVQNFIKTNASSTTLPILNKANFSKLPIPLPPLATQNQIVQILESKFAHLEKLEQFVNASLENLQRLKSSLLNQAFKGELV